jgi:hypothetical protein
MFTILPGTRVARNSIRQSPLEPRVFVLVVASDESDESFYSLFSKIESKYIEKEN